MLTKIGEVTSKFGISHRSLHYWESAGIFAEQPCGKRLSAL